ncbi:TetR/AcrR family transcriptional regulator [Amycolatopsis sp. NPDC003861]
MSVDWETSGTEGLRERKKRQLRRKLTDTATAMFLERGFDAVRVAEIAAACDVSEKTVFNHFPSKEALILDRSEATMAALRAGLAEPGRTPVEAVLAILDGELAALLSWVDTQPDPAGASARVRAFTALVRSTPALRAHHRDTTEQLEAVAAEALAARTGRAADDPLCRISATALLGLWGVQSAALHRNLDGERTPDQVRRAVTEDVHSAARLLDTGLAGLAGNS